MAVISLQPLAIRPHLSHSRPSAAQRDWKAGALRRVFGRYRLHKRYDPLVEAWSLEAAVELSYRKSGKEVRRGSREGVVSGEVVKKVIHDWERTYKSVRPLKE